MSDKMPSLKEVFALNENDALKNMGIERTSIVDKDSAARAIQKYVSQISFATKALQSILDRQAELQGQEDVGEAFKAVADELDGVIQAGEAVRRSLHTLVNAGVKKAAGQPADPEKKFSKDYPNRGYRSDD